jgi:hypothetical protein
MMPGYTYGSLKTICMANLPSAFSIAMRLINAPFVAFWGKWKEDQNSTNQWSVKHQKSVRFTVLGAGKQRVPPKAQLGRKQIGCGWMTMRVTFG